MVVQQIVSIHDDMYTSTAAPLIGDCRKVTIEPAFGGQSALFIDLSLARSRDT
jgi:hypothetical protein